MSDKSYEVREFNERARRGHSADKLGQTFLSKDQLDWALKRIEKQAKDTGKTHDEVVKQWIDNL